MKTDVAKSEAGPAPAAVGTGQPRPDPSVRTADGQASIVRDHFRDYSRRWGDRYAGRPKSMADLDLLLRRESLHALLRPILDTADRALDVLDVGCGAGNVLDGIPRDRIHVTGVDFVPQMVRSAADAHSDDRFLVGDAARLPIAPASFDLITCMGTLEYVVNPDVALAGFARILRPGGWALVSFPNSKSLFRKLVRVERGCLAAYAAIRNVLTGRQPASEVAPPYRHTQWSIPQARALLTRAGLEVEIIRCSTYGPWGRLGRLRASVYLSGRISRRFHAPGAFARFLAGTLVVRARKLGPAPNLPLPATSP